MKNITVTHNAEVGGEVNANVWKSSSYKLSNLVKYVQKENNTKKNNNSGKRGEKALIHRPGRNTSHTHTHSLSCLLYTSRCV